MKNPNGYGSIAKMKDTKRRKPWRVRITSCWDWDDEKESARQVQRDLGFFRTRPEAVKALAIYNADPYDIDAQRTTFGEIYKILWDDVFIYKGKSMQILLRSAFGNCTAVHDIPMGKIKATDWKKVFTALEGKSQSTIKNVKLLAGQVYAYCNEEAEMKLRNYAKKVEVKAATPKAKGSFSLEEITSVWDNLDLVLPRDNRISMNVPFNDTLIIMSYTGMRISELLEMESSCVKTDDNGNLYIELHGTKTEAAERLIPVHNKIIPLIQRRLAANNEYLIFDGDGNPLKYDTYSRLFFKPMMEHLSINKSIHECRHTFATFAKRSGMDTLARKLITGHAIQDFTDRVYTHYDLQDLQREMAKLKILD